MNLRGFRGITPVQQGNYTRPTQLVEVPIQMPEENLEVLVRVSKQMKEAIERLQERLRFYEGGAASSAAPSQQQPFYVDPAWYGASPGATAAVNAQALLQAASTGLPVKWGPGNFKIDPVEINNSSGQTFSMRGAGRYGTKLLQYTGGIKVNVTRTNDTIRQNSSSVDVDEITFIAAAADVPYALWYNWTNWSSTGDSPGAILRGQNHTISRCAIGASSSSFGYLYGFRVSGTSDIMIDNCLMILSNYVGSAIYFDHPGGEFRPSGNNNKIRHCNITGWDRAVDHVAAGEGLLLYHNSFVCNTGLYCYWASEPGEEVQVQVQVLGGHMNCTDHNVYIENWNDVHVSDVLFYHRGTCVGVEVTRPGFTSKRASISIHDNIFRLADETRVAIKLGENVGMAAVHDNILPLFTGQSIVLAATTAGCFGTNYGTSTSPVTDLGTDNHVTIVNAAGPL